ncbi:hypothetical protein N9X63_05870 [Woeseiaceae bacterium]|nr:hypothetical protein [Woeseiaceae bacterium]
MTIKKIYTIDGITDEHLIDFIAGEITDQGLYDFIENSPSLKTRLESYKKTFNLVDQLEPYLQEDNGLDNYSHITEAAKSSDYSDSSLSWPAKLRANSASILLDQSQASYGLAASILIAVALYFNVQSPAPEWQDRYNALGFDSEFIAAADWSTKADEVTVYALPNMNSNELTVNIANPSFVSDTPNDLAAPDSVKDISNPTALDKELSNIDTRLTSKFLAGALYDMHSKKIVTGKLTQPQNKAITLSLYGENSMQKQCILGEINYESDTVLSNTINSKFFNFCVLDTGNPIQMIN